MSTAITPAVSAFCCARSACPVFIFGPDSRRVFDTRAARGNGESESLKRRAALKDRTQEIESNREFRIGDIDFMPFSVPHDAAIILGVSRVVKA